MFPKKMDLYFTTSLVVCQFIFLISKSQYRQLKKQHKYKKTALKKSCFLPKRKRYFNNLLIFHPM